MSSDDQVVSPHVSFWKQAWDNKATGWHLQKLNPALADYGERFFGPDSTSATTILFPLCGKSLDMTILADKYKVVGIEGVELALNEYAAENDSKLVPVDTDVDAWRKFTLPLNKSENEVKPVVDLYLGDFFDFKPENSPIQVDRVFDRGSLVAIKPDMRKPYVKIINSILKKGGKWMFATMAYDQALYPGPPHSIGETDIADLIKYIEDETGDKYTTEVYAKHEAHETSSLAFSRFLKANGGPLETFIDYVIVIEKQ